eukprot:m.44024 g.44024  ORF g.44024 m.44024 type:complete len:229 (-) comp46909_c0_seq1:247-933(-)
MTYFNALFNIVVLLCLLISAICVIVALASSSWVSSTESSVGIFSRCNAQKDLSISCSNISSNDIANQGWYAGAALIILALLVQAVSFVLVAISLNGERRMSSRGKIAITITAVLMMIAAIVIPASYRDLDSTCPSGISANSNSCGLKCSSGRDFSAFSLCHPWSTGSASFIFIVGVVLLFLAAIFSSCVRYHDDDDGSEKNDTPRSSDDSSTTKGSTTILRGGLRPRN